MGILTVLGVVVEASSHYCVGEVGVAAGLHLEVKGEHIGG